MMSVLRAMAEWLQLSAAKNFLFGRGAEDTLDAVLVGERYSDLMKL